MQKWRSLQIDPLDKHLTEEAARLRKEARGHLAWGRARQAYSQGAARGNRLPHEGMAFLTRPEGSDLKINPPQLVVLENGRIAMHIAAHDKGPRRHQDRDQAPDLR
jgi:hypothetical protein